MMVEEFEKLDKKLDTILNNQEIIIKKLDKIQKDMIDGSAIDKLQLIMQTASIIDLIQSK